VRTAQALQALTPQVAGETWSQRAADAVTGWLSRRTSRRGFLARSAVVGSALAVDTAGFLLKPQSAYASVCGPGSTCASGWTVFCATINKGVNSCPPGSIAAGWWKADGASLCGGKARYIIDCNATCSRCAPSGRAGICSSSCWSCRCTCGPAGQCDQRRVCCNGFRYGQCNQQVRQVGGVVCRVVSCRPPWTFERCSTAPATDNTTRDHNSPALPGAWTALTARYVQLGEMTSPLGPTVNGEIGIPGGRAQRYVNGRMSWKPDIGPRYTAGPIAVRYTALGAEAGVLGYPIADPTSFQTARASRFQRGRISYHPGLGAFETLGPIAVRYNVAGNEPGRLGFPTGPPVVPSDGTGRASPFQRGRISWHPDLGARLLGAPLALRFVELQAESGRLGYPLVDEVVVADGIVAGAFQKGRISWSSATGAIETYDVIAEAHVRSGGEKGPLGLPVASEQVAGSGRAQRFQTGRVSVGGPAAFFTRGPIAAKYVELGAETGTLGMPTTDEYKPSDGVRRNDFQNGTISYDEATGEVSVTLAGGG
jgi:uncharacterized protein with LGFP repeats